MLYRQESIPGMQMRQRCDDFFDIPFNRKKWVFSAMLDNTFKVNKNLAFELMGNVQTPVIQGTFDIEDEDLIPVEDVIISLTNNGYVKRMPVDTYKSQNRGGRGVKGMSTTQDDVISSLIHMSTHDDLLIFTNKGKVYRLKVLNH